jgi:hypothetical protein
MSNISVLSAVTISKMVVAMPMFASKISRKRSQERLCVTPWICLLCLLYGITLP